MRSFFSWLSTSQITDLLPKVKVALELYNRYGSMLAQADIQQQVSSVDADVWWLLSLVYTQKQSSRKEIRSWIKQKEQMSETIVVSVSDMSRVENKHLDNVTVVHHDKIWLEAIGQWHIYKRTLNQDIEKLLQ